MRPCLLARLAVLHVLLFVAPAARAQSPEPISEEAPGDTPPLRPAVEAEPAPPPPPSAAPAPAPLQAGAAPTVTDAPPSAAEPNWYEDLDLNALVSVAVIHNFAVNRPLAGVNIARLFDRDNDSIKIDLATVAIGSEPDGPGKAGFRLDIAHGQVVPAVIGGSDIALQQAFVSYIAPWGSGLRFDVGTFLSRIGAETIDNFDSFDKTNDTYSRSLLFGAAPPELTGGRIAYRFGDFLDLKLLVVNGWQPNIIDNNTGKTLGLQLAFTPDPLFTLQVHYLAGPERPYDNADWRHLVDAVAVLHLQPVKLILEGQWGHETNIDWGGALLTVRWEVVGGFSLAARAEYFDDADKFRNLGARVVEFTFAPSYKMTDNALVRLEYRHDHSVSVPAVPIFAGAKDGLRISQDTLAANFVFVF